MIPNLINQHPTAWKGLTQYEILSTVIKVIVYHGIFWVLLFAIFGTPIAVTIFSFCFGFCTGGLYSFFKLSSLAKKKQGTPFGYLERKIFKKSLLYRLGFVSDKTIYRNGTWRHYE
jgi:conjugative transfer region protein (TIGR03750 family)